MVHRHEAHWASYKANKRWDFFFTFFDQKIGFVQSDLHQRYKMFHHALANGNYYLCQKKRDALGII